MELKHLSFERIAALVDEVPINSDAEDHLKHCERCRREVNAMRQLVATVAKLPEFAPPDREWAQIAVGLPLRRERPRKRELFARLFVGTPMLRMAAIIVLVFGAGLFTGQAIFRRSGSATTAAGANAWLSASQKNHELLGADLISLGRDLGGSFAGINNGLLVVRVAPGTPGSRLGLLPGDVITQAGGSRLENVSELRALLEVSGANGIALTWIRKGTQMVATLRTP